MKRLCFILFLVSVGICLHAGDIRLGLGGIRVSQPSVASEPAPVRTVEIIMMNPTMGQMNTMVHVEITGNGFIDGTTLLLVGQNQGKVNIGAPMVMGMGGTSLQADIDLSVFGIEPHLYNEIMLVDPEFGPIPVPATFMVTP